MLDILQEILQSHLFLMSQKFERQRCHKPELNVYKVKSIFADKGNSLIRFGAPLYYLKQSSSHFFNKTDLEQ